MNHPLPIGARVRIDSDFPPASVRVGRVVDVIPTPLGGAWYMVEAENWPGQLLCWEADLYPLHPAERPADAPRRAAA